MQDCKFFFLKPDFDILMFGRKSNIKAEGFLVCVFASDATLDFFEAFHALFAYLVSFLASLIGLHFQVLVAIILLFIMVTIVYSIPYCGDKITTSRCWSSHI